MSACPDTLPETLGSAQAAIFMVRAHLAAHAAHPEPGTDAGTLDALHDALDAVEEAERRLRSVLPHNRRRAAA